MTPGHELIECDFVPRRGVGSKPGMLLLLLGATAVLAALMQYRMLHLQAAGLEMRAAALRRPPPTTAATAPIDSRSLAGVRLAAEDLATPWTLLLAELEQASRDTQEQVAVLGVEPDHGKHSVRISAEARSLSAALEYVQRLQGSRSIRYPMLDRHEVRIDQAQQPIRFEMTGEWRDRP